jgi:hypothetical protein
MPNGALQTRKIMGNNYPSSSILENSDRSQCFANCICFRPILLVPLEIANPNHWTAYVSILQLYNRDHVLSAVDNGKIYNKD